MSEPGRKDQMVWAGVALLVIAMSYKLGWPFFGV